MKYGFLGILRGFHDSYFNKVAQAAIKTLSSWNYVGLMKSGNARHIQRLLKINDVKSLTVLFDDKYVKKAVAAPGKITKKQRNIQKAENWASFEILQSLLGPDLKLSENIMFQVLCPSVSETITQVEETEKLKRLGGSILRLQCQLSILLQPSSGKYPIVNGLDFSRMTDPDAGDELVSDRVIRLFLKRKMIPEAIICDDPAQEKHRNYYAASSLFMLIGTVNKIHGMHNTARFVRDRIIESTDGLMDLSLRLKSGELTDETDK